MAIKNSLLSLLLVCATLQGCDSYLVVLPRFVNNTGDRITILSYDIASDENRYVVEAGASVVTAFPFRLTIVRSNARWSYDLQKLREASGAKDALKNYELTRWNGSHLVTLQVQSNGSIYVLEPTVAGVSSTPPAQPPGFPLRPG